MILWLHQHFLRRHDERWVCHLQRSLELDVRARSLLRVASSQVATLRFVMARTCGMISHGVQRFLMLFNGESQPKCNEILTKEMSKFFWLWVWLDTKILVAYNWEDLIGQTKFRTRHHEIRAFWAAMRRVAYICRLTWMLWIKSCHSKKNSKLK